ncbi:MAG: SDR family oxidoreductase [Rhodospirillales bacterium]|jgi:3-oxoacyl-[acyl-carrier protein] reductase|nr:short-chain dehydrogenase [Rhodospirillaceae bacterium]MDP6430323.1 SDR family oxidoreductase [Rhodospirillales bacterium]MDP6646403.1 SDR family oxidoreductase [Rhodospirillales bacterium]|tara:strand:- start:668 stop:1444 length:777 start_codon:yes stop_codon:yes gene_type:complete
MAENSGKEHSGKELAGKTAFVTGGSNGIGAAAARMLADAGAAVMIGYNRGEDRARKLVQELPGSGHHIQQLALEDGASVRAAAAAAEAAYPALNILVNSAGFTRPIPHDRLDELDDEFMDAMLIANVRGPFSVIRALAPALKASGDGVIINVSSVSAFTGMGSNIAYVATKAAIDAISMSLARVLGPEIRVMCVSPGAVATDFVAGRGRPQLEKLMQGSPLGRVTEPEDVARAILACITHLKATTGDRIIVDGGRFLG